MWARGNRPTMCPPPAANEEKGKGTEATEGQTAARKILEDPVSVRCGLFVPALTCAEELKSGLKDLSSKST